MAALTKQFDHYRIFYMTGTTDQPETPWIDCFEGTSHVGKLAFHIPEQGRRLGNEVVNGVIYLRYSLSQFGDIIGILRHEKRLQLHISDSLNGIGRLANEEREPVGRQDV